MSANIARLTALTHRTMFVNETKKAIRILDKTLPEGIEVEDIIVDGPDLDSFVVRYLPGLALGEDESERRVLISFSEIPVFDEGEEQRSPGEWMAENLGTEDLPIAESAEDPFGGLFGDRGIAIIVIAPPDLEEPKD